VTDAGFPPLTVRAASLPPGLLLYGKTHFGNERTTFVIGPDGKVAQVLRKVKPAEHDERVLKALDEATAPAV
jgi:peroxiredoxin